ncbi:hypothetical protein KIN20_003421 [Parelaphostrongylus tenuis]|uniref:Uncharacterized protein n=1 Tax=Parelaphostrongylus tenuis TaxID=148309 RepID=A0AAD5QIL1_PARTN|nr:hypothetical protein KIN20_003421 [Parelaphostrongylus tenuis]
MEDQLRCTRGSCTTHTVRSLSNFSFATWSDEEIAMNRTDYNKILSIFGTPKRVWRARSIVGLLLGATECHHRSAHIHKWNVIE